MGNCIFGAVRARRCALLAGDLIRSHIACVVEIECYVDRRVIRSAVTGLPLRGLFVDPRSGLLRRAPDPPRERRKRS
jgi:hypothetical protein